MKAMFSLLVVSVLVPACGTPPRPVGLPAPEYEEPKVEPWSPPAASEPAPAPAAEPVPSGAPAGSSVAPPPVAPAEPAAAPVPANAGGSGATLPAGTP